MNKVHIISRLTYKLLWLLNTAGGWTNAQWGGGTGTTGATDRIPGGGRISALLPPVRGEHRGTVGGSHRPCPPDAQLQCHRVLLPPVDTHHFHEPRFGASEGCGCMAVLLLHSLTHSCHFARAAGGVFTGGRHDGHAATVLQGNIASAIPDKGGETHGYRKFLWESDGAGTRPGGSKFVDGQLLDQLHCPHRLSGPCPPLQHCLLAICFLLQ